MSAENQTSAVLAALQQGRAITPLEALREFGCMRLGARIWDLKQDGHNIENIWEHGDGKKWAKYRLVRSAAG